MQVINTPKKCVVLLFTLLSIAKCNAAGRRLALFGAHCARLTHTAKVITPKIFSDTLTALAWKDWDQKNNAFPSLKKTDFLHLNQKVYNQTVLNNVYLEDITQLAEYIKQIREEPDEPLVVYESLIENYVNQVAWPTDIATIEWADYLTSLIASIETYQYGELSTEEAHAIKTIILREIDPGFQQIYLLDLLTHNHFARSKYYFAQTSAMLRNTAIRAHLLSSPASSLAESTMLELSTLIQETHIKKALIFAQKMLAKLKTA